MSELGVFLERFYGPEQTFASVHARVRRTKKAATRHESSAKQSTIGRPRRDRKPSSELVEDLVMWGQLPDKVRIESTRQKDDQVEKTIEIVNGDDRWKRFADGSVEKGPSSRRRPGDSPSLPTEFQRHFDRCLLRERFAALTLETIGTCQIAALQCCLVSRLHENPVLIESGQLVA